MMTLWAVDDKIEDQGQAVPSGAAVRDMQADRLGQLEAEVSRCKVWVRHLTRRVAELEAYRDALERAPVGRMHETGAQVPRQRTGRDSEGR